MGQLWPQAPLSLTVCSLDRMMPGEQALAPASHQIRPRPASGPTPCTRPKRSLSRGLRAGKQREGGSQVGGGPPWGAGSSVSSPPSRLPSSVEVQAWLPPSWLRDLRPDAQVLCFLTCRNAGHHIIYPTCLSRGLNRLTPVKWEEYLAWNQ